MKRKLLVWFGGLALLILLIAASPSRAFPVSLAISVSAGSDVGSISQQLGRQNVVRAPLLFRVLVGALGPRRGALAGDYIFERPLSVWGVAWRLTRGLTSTELVKITLPEGLANEEMAEILAARLIDFDRQLFLTLAAPEQGRLFPDTYFFPPTAGPRQVIPLLRANFEARIESLSPQIAVSGRGLDQILTMASLVEKEANDPADRRLIAGILWKRLDAEMPLQVDAVFPYLVGRNSFEVTSDDLALDSPYNTYRTRGLPPAPIVNPGLESIKAVLEPTSSDYWFYLSDRRGEFYFAKDFDAHKSNKLRYLQ